VDFIALKRDSLKAGEQTGGAGNGSGDLVGLLLADEAGGYGQKAQAICRLTCGLDSAGVMHRPAQHLEAAANANDRHALAGAGEDCRGYPCCSQMKRVRDGRLGAGNNDQVRRAQIPG